MGGGGPVQRSVLGFTTYPWLVLFAAWLGSGLGVFDAVLFNYVARLVISSPRLGSRSSIAPRGIVTWSLTGRRFPACSTYPLDLPAP
jgi:hypothetical protein